MKWPTGALESIAILDRRSIHPSQTEAATLYLRLEHLDGDGQINCIETVASAGLKSNKFQSGSVPTPQTTYHRVGQL